MTNVPTDVSETWEQITEGKTKVVFRSGEDPRRGKFRSKPDVTAGDGKKHIVLPDKDVLSNRTTCGTFQLLKDCGLPVAYEQMTSDTEFIGPLCTMLKFEVVTRRKAKGSFRQRNPGVPDGTVFPRLVFELFLKTTGNRWGEHVLPCDDPLMRIDWATETVALYNPHAIIHGQEPFLTLPFSEVFNFKNVREVVDKMEEIARKQFLVFERAWSLLDRDFVDIKVEFGVPADGFEANVILVNMILLADVIDGDSWRVVYKGRQQSKQAFRDGEDNDRLMWAYTVTAEMVARFGLPNQQIIIWTGSRDDDVTVFNGALVPFRGPDLMVKMVVCSMHKEPVRGINLLNALLGEKPDSVIVDFVGMSNGAGPTLSANSPVPVINVPVNAPGTDKPFAEDIWSSLRLPSNVPAMTVLNPKNAIQAALQILAMRNPRLHMLLRYEQEKRMTNVVLI